MIAKARKRSRRKQEPLDISLSVSFRFGDEPDDRLTVMDQRSIPMVGTIFDKRDAVMKGFAKLFIKAASMRPSVAAEFVPFLSTITPRRRRKRPE